MSYENAVENILELPTIKTEGWLAVVDEVHTLSARELRRLSQRIPLKMPVVRLVSISQAVFDEAAAKRYFAENGGWVPTHISVDELREVMPCNIVSNRARRVGVSPTIIDLFEEGMAAKVATVSKNLFTLAEDEDKKCLAIMNLAKRVFACSCPAYNGELPCKHILLAVYHHHDVLLEQHDAYVAEEWKKSLIQAQRHQHRRTMLCNWLYYFVKDSFSHLHFKAGRYEDSKIVEKAMAFMEKTG